MESIMLLKKILCAVDLADEATNAAEYANMLAKGSGAHVELVSVAPHPTYHIGLRTFHDSDEKVEKKIRDHYAPLLKDFAARHFPGQEVKTTLLYGDPAAELITYCQKKEWDLVILATHSRTGIDKLLLGSVAQKVVNLVDIPVLTLKPVL